MPNYQLRLRAMYAAAERRETASPIPAARLIPAFELQKRLAAAIGADIAASANGAPCPNNASDFLKWLLDSGHFACMGLRLAGATLRALNFRRADFSRADFRAADLSEVFADGATFALAEFAGADARDARFLASDFTGADFRGANLCHAQLIGCRLAGADFRGADLYGAKVVGCDFGEGPAAATFFHG